MDKSAIVPAIVLGLIVIGLIFAFNQGLNVDQPKADTNRDKAISTQVADIMSDVVEHVPKPVKYVGAGIGVVLQYGFYLLGFLVVFWFFWNGRSG